MMKPILPAFVCLKGLELLSDEASILQEYNPMGITLFKRNIDHPDQVQKLTNDIRLAVGRDDFLIATDQEGGVVRRLRPPYWHEYISQQKLGFLPPDEAREAIRLHATLIAHDLRVLGINMDFTPVADTLHHDTTGAIASRCFSDKPEIVAECAELMAKTLMENGVCPCMKHLPGHGLANTDSHTGLPIITADEKVIQHDFLPFQKLASFIPMGMTAHIVLPYVDNQPITQSAKGIELIRNQIGFDGLLITDALEMQALQGTLPEKVQKSLSAGCDVVCYCSGHDQNNPNMLADNIDVLKACAPISDKTLSRLEKVNRVISKNAPTIDVETLTARYDELAQKAQTLLEQGIDYTENWSKK